ncbi:MAG: Flp pilus assembly protein CpaB [Planctomycetota bacterium]|nr:MAG: Flp pilus assembly protein CpaB [Planctomycetota bacterium]
MRNLTPAKVTILMLVVVALLVTAYIGKRLIATEEKPPERPQTRNVPMAVADLEPGTVITEAHIGQGPVRVDQLEPDMLLSTRVIIGRVVKERIPAATPIRASQLYRPGERPEIELRDGYRAITLAVGETVDMVDGLIMPGDYVDVHLTPNIDASDERVGGGLAITLMKAVRVLAINRNFAAATIERGINTVTLELTPRQANMLVLAQRRGTITLSYNPEGERIARQLSETGNPDRVTLDEILQLPEPPKPQEPYAVEEYRAAARTIVEFRNGRRLPLRTSYLDDAANTGRRRPAAAPRSGVNSGAPNRPGDDASRTVAPAPTSNGGNAFDQPPAMPSASVDRAFPSRRLLLTARREGDR